MDWFNYISELPLPYLTLFILFVNVCVVLIGSLIFRLTLNVDRIEAQELEVRSFERSFKAAKQSNDKAALRRLKREDIRMKRISASASKQRLKVVMLTILPFTVVSLILSTLYTGKEVIRFPFEFFIFNKDFSFSVWYFLTYLAAYLPLSKVFRSSPSLWGSSEVRSG